LLEAWNLLCREPSWDAELAVTGYGAELPKWRRRAAELRIDKRIRFLGFRSDISTVIAASDVMVHPARYEAYGLGVHEAICRGLPAIVTAAAGVTERYPESLVGLIVPDPPQSEAMVSALRAWRAHVGEWRSRTEQAGAALRG